MQKRTATVLLGVALVAAAGMVGWLLTRGARGRAAVGAAEASAEAEVRGARLPAAARGEPAARPGDAAPAPDAPSPANAPSADPAGDLRRALLAADKEARTDADILEAKRLLEHVLRAHPELAAALAGTLKDLENRKLAFVISRVLGRFVRDPAVRAALLAEVRDGGEVAREAAIYTFVGLKDDGEVAGAVATSFTDRDAPARVRTAAAFGLVEMLPALPPAEAEAVRAEARQLVVSGEADPEMRAEAVDLLDVASNVQDRGTARHLLEASGVGVPSGVTLAAARALLTNGEPEEQVLPWLERLAEQGLDGMAQRSLRAILEEHRSGPAPDGARGE